MRFWFLLLLLCLSLVACKSEEESGLAEDPDEAEDEGEKPEPAADASAKAPDVPAGPDPAEVAAAVRGALPEDGLVYSGKVVDHAGASWLAMNDVPFAPAPSAVPAGECTPVEAEAEGFWTIPSTPATVLALGDVPQLHVWDHDRKCFVSAPVFILPELDGEPLIEVSASADELTVIQIDLFPDTPGKEVLSVGSEGFRVDRGEGPGAIRTGPMGLPITRTDATTAQTPPAGDWEAQLSPVPKDAKWAETPPERTEEELEAMDGRQLLEAAWDDAIPLVASTTDYPSLDAVHPDYVPTPDDEDADEEEADEEDADEEEEEDSGHGDCYEEDAEDTFSVAVSSVAGGWMFAGSLLHTESADYCGESTQDARELIRTDLLRLRDGRVITAAELTETSEDTTTSGYQEEASSESEDNVHTVLFYVASTLGNGEEDRESPTAPRPANAPMITRTVSQAIERSSDNSATEAGDEEGCSSSSASMGIVKADSIDWIIAQGGTDTLFEMLDPNADEVELVEEGVKEGAVPPFDAPRRVVEGKVFGDKMMKLAATPAGVQILGENDDVLFDYPTECPSEDWTAPETTASFLATVKAVPLQNGTALVHLEHTVGIETETDTLECFQERTVLLSPSGFEVESYAETTSFTTQAESCDPADAMPSDPP